MTTTEQLSRRLSVARNEIVDVELQLAEPQSAGQRQTLTQRHEALLREVEELERQLRVPA